MIFVCCILPWILKGLGTILIVLITGAITLYGYNLQISKNRRVKWINDIREAFADFSGNCSSITEKSDKHELRKLASSGWKVFYMLSPRVEAQQEMRNRVARLIMGILANEDRIPDFLKLAGEQLDVLIEIEEKRLNKLWLF